MTTRVLFLMSDTGGGHRAAAEAIRDALIARYGTHNIAATLVDVFKASYFPMNYMPELYPWIINHSKSSWGLGYKASNTKRRAAVLSRAMYLANARRFKRLVQQHQADVVVCVHSVIARPVLRAYHSMDERPPFVTVVTDLVSTHMFWYDQRADATMVPTQAAYDRGLQCGLSDEQMRVTGLPVHPDFLESLVGQEQSREALGWDKGKVTVLMVSGGDGMGPVYKTARAIDEKRLGIQLAVVAGRNKSLKRKLDNVDWHSTTHIYPFVTNMPQLMDAADIIVTKAGPATITEAGIAGLPLIISDMIPGQEEGNVKYIIENDAGVYAPEPQQVADTVERWVNEGKAGLATRAENARRIAHPDAVWDIAESVMEWADKGFIPTPDKSLWDKTRDFMNIPD